MTDTSGSNQYRQEILSIEKRLDDLKWYIGIFSGAIAVMYTGLAVFVGLNLSSERSSLKDYKESLRQELRESIGATIAVPTLLLQSHHSKPLEGATIPGNVWVDAKGQKKISFKIVVRNDGKGRSGDIFAKAYSTDLHLEHEEIDDTGFKYETFIRPESFNPGELFGGTSIEYTMNFLIREDPSQKTSLHTIHMVYFYSNGQRTEATFKIRL